MKYLIIIFGIFANASASLLIKYSTVAPRSFPSFNDPFQAIKNWPFWMGVFLYGLAFVLYGMSLARFPLNTAHPVLTAGSIILVSIFSLAILKEPFTWSYLLGILVVLAGIILITTKPSLKLFYAIRYNS